MNSFLSLFFCSLAPAVTFAWNANEKPPFIPLSATQNQRHNNPRQGASFPGYGLTVQKFLQLKYALELKCLKELCNHVRYRHICYGGKPFQSSRLMPPVQPIPQPQILFFNKVKENPSVLRRQNGPNGKYFPKDKMIYSPPNKYLNNMRRNPPPQEETKMANNSQQTFSKIQPGETSKIVQEENLLDQLLPEDKESRELPLKNLPRETEKVAIVNEDIPFTRSPENGKPAEVKPSRPIIRPPIHQYEVREIIDEKPESYKYSNDFRGFQLGSKKLANVSLLMNEKPDLQELKNTSLMFKPVKTPPTLYPLPSHHPRVLIEKNIEPQRFHQEHPEMKNLFNDYFRLWRENTTVEPKTHAPSYNSITFSPEHVNKADLRATTQTEKYTTSLYSSEVVVTETKFNRSGLTKTSESVEDTQLLGSTYPNTPDFIHSGTTETIKGFSLFPTLKKTGNPITMTSSEVQTTSSVFWQTTDNWRSTKDSNTSPTAAKTEFIDTKNQADITTPSLKEITDGPAFNFFTKMKPEIKKDYDGSLKNSRKMHFGQETWKTTMSNEISDLEQNEPRRSDILISENNDYFDYDNNFSDVNYLKKLQLNHSFNLQNLTSEAIIPLIPTVVNDLRDGRISVEDMSTLSEIFGKYWTTVVDLSNNTALDMLPLMKLKDEKDLENLIRNLQPEEGSNKPTTEVDDYSYFTLGAYDFLENYKDLYKDFTMEDEEAAGEYNFDITNVTPFY